jgi:hypothetical protein
MTLTRRLAAKALGTALLLATVVSSGIMAERLAGGNVAIALLANTIATGAALVALILTFGAVSGGHFRKASAGVPPSRQATRPGSPGSAGAAAARRARAPDHPNRTSGRASP